MVFRFGLQQSRSEHVLSIILVSWGFVSSPMLSVDSACAYAFSLWTRVSHWLQHGLLSNHCLKFLLTSTSSCTYYRILLDHLIPLFIWWKRSWHWVSRGISTVCASFPSSKVHQFHEYTKYHKTHDTSWTRRIGKAWIPAFNQARRTALV
jgi:hypothetical protein